MALLLVVASSARRPMRATHRLPAHASACTRLCAASVKQSSQPGNGPGYGGDGSCHVVCRRWVESGSCSVAEWHSGTVICAWQSSRIRLICQMDPNCPNLASARERSRRFYSRFTFLPCLPFLVYWTLATSSRATKE